MVIKLVIFDCHCTDHFILLAECNCAVCDPVSITMSFQKLKCKLKSQQ